MCFHRSPCTYLAPSWPLGSPFITLNLKNIRSQKRRDEVCIIRAGAEEWNFAVQWWLLYQPTWEISDKCHLPWPESFFFCNYIKNALLFWAAANKWLVTYFWEAFSAKLHKSDGNSNRCKTMSKSEVIACYSFSRLLSTQTEFCVLPYESGNNTSVKWVFQALK